MFWKKHCPPDVFSDVLEKVKHRTNDASNDANRPALSQNQWGWSWFLTHRNLTPAWSCLPPAPFSMSPWQPHTAPSFPSLPSPASLQSVRDWLFLKGTLVQSLEVMLREQGQSFFIINKIMLKAALEQFRRQGGPFAFRFSDRTEDWKLLYNIPME